MEVEVLLACTNQKDFSIAEKSNLKTDAVIINQFDENSYSEINRKNKSIKCITSDQRGLTRSRNLALAYASKEICVLCDDDVNYVNDYKEKILEAFIQLPEADIIIFDIERIGYDREIKPMEKIRKAPRFKSYGSVRIAFKLESIKKNNIWFDENFGSGSIYSSGEETVFLNEAHEKRLKIYEYPAILAKVDFSSSTWREGYNEKFFFDKGAMLSAAYSKYKYFFMFYFLKNLSKHSSLSLSEILKWTIRGMKSYPSKTPYSDY